MPSSGLCTGSMGLWRGDGSLPRPPGAPEGRGGVHSLPGVTLLRAPGTGFWAHGKVTTVKAQPLPTPGTLPCPPRVGDGPAAVLFKSPGLFSLGTPRGNHPDPAPSFLRWLRSQGRVLSASSWPVPRDDRGALPGGQGSPLSDPSTVWPLPPFWNCWKDIPGGREVLGPGPGSGVLPTGCQGPSVFVSSSEKLLACCPCGLAGSAPGAAVGCPLLPPACLVPGSCSPTAPSSLSRVPPGPSGGLVQQVSRGGKGHKTRTSPWGRGRGRGIGSGVTGQCLVLSLCLSVSVSPSLHVHLSMFLCACLSVSISPCRSLHPPPAPSQPHPS